MSDGDRLRPFFDPTGRGALVTLKRDGRPQISTVDFCFDTSASVLRISTVRASAKVANLRRDPRASLYVPSSGLGTYAVAEGDAELSAVSAELDDATVEELIEVYRAVQGEHPDWDDYRRAMVADRRLVIRLRVDRLYGFAPETA
jgi:PPOX class probable F420-dependent enzyme